LSSAVHALEVALEDGRLIMPFDVALPSGRAYYFVYPKTKAKQPNVLALRNWLRDEIGQLDARLLGAN
jgi:LysR family glycine cleavage system transcriptional activator